MELNTITPHKKKIYLLAIVGLLALGNIFFGVEYALQAVQNQKLQQQITQQKTNAKVLAFLNLFIEKVLKTNKEVSFNDRLQLENAIRDINDPALLVKWEQFTGGQNIDQIQSAVKDLLEALVRKLS